MKKRKLIATFGAAAAIGAIIMPTPYDENNVEAAAWKLDTVAPGGVVHIKVNGVAKSFVVLEHTANGQTVVIQQNVEPNTVIWNTFEGSMYNNTSIFKNSSIYNLLNTTYYNSIDSNVRNNIPERSWDVYDYSKNSNGPSGSAVSTTARVSLLNVRDIIKYKNLLNNLIFNSQEWTSDQNSSGISGTEGKIIIDASLIDRSTEGKTPAEFAVGLGTGTYERSYKYYRPMFSITSGIILSTDGTAVTDTTPPTITATEQASYGKTSRITVNATDDVTGVNKILYVQGSYTTANFPSGAANITTAKYFDATANGTYSILAEDGVGNKTVQTITVNKVDTTAPSLTVAAVHTNPTNNDVMINVTATDNHSGLSSVKWAAGSQTAQYFVNAGTPVSNNGFVVTENGTYTVYAEDYAGNSLVKTVTVSNIDKTPPPDPTFRKSTTEPTNEPVYVTINYSNDSAQKLYKVGINGTWKTYNSPVEITENGTIFSKAIDAVGNVSNEVHENVSNIDIMAPDISVTTNYDGKNKKQFTATIGATDNVAIASIRYAWALDSNILNVLTWTDTTNGNTILSPLDDGEYYFHAIATDTAGNTTEHTESHAFIVDNTPPNQPVINADITEPTKQNVTVTPTFSTDSVLNEIKVNDASWKRYDRPVIFEENGYLEARSTDEAGNVSSIAHLKITNIDKTPPVAPTLSTDTTEWVNQNVKVTAVFSDDTALGEYSLDNASTWHPYTEPVVVTSNQEVKFRATDAVGNTNTPTSITISNIDKEPPAVPTTNYVTNGKTLTFTPGVDNVADKATIALYRLNGGEWETFSTELTLNDDAYEIDMKTVDHVGNESPVVTFEWRVYYQALQDAVNATIVAETAITQESINEAKLKIEAMGAVQETADLLTRIEAVQLIVNDINLANEIQSDMDGLSYADMTQVDLTAIEQKINQLMETPRKVNAQSKMANIHAMYNARSAVERAELSTTQVDKDIAENLVNSLLPNAFQTELTNRLEIVQGIIDYRNLVESIELKVATAELSSELGNTNITQMTADFTAANDLFVNATKESAILKLKDADKERFEQRLTAISALISENEQIIVVENTFAEVGTDEYAFEQNDLDRIKSELDKLTSLSIGSIQDAFNQGLEALQTAYNYRLYKANVDEKVTQAETSLNQLDHDVASDLLMDLNEADKTYFADRLKNVQLLINDNLLANQITTAFEALTFDSMSQSDIDAIDAMIQQALQSARKDGFVTQLAAQQQLLNARLAVELAEQDLKQVDKDTAKALIDALPGNTIQSNLNDRLTIVQQKIDYREFVKELERLTSVAEVSSELGATDIAQMEADYALVKAKYDAGIQEGASVQLKPVDANLYEQRLVEIDLLIKENKQILQVEQAFINLGHDVTTMNQSQLDAIKEEIDRLTNLSVGAIQSGLIQRITAIQSAYDYHLYKLDVEAAVNKAEQSLVQEDHTTAHELLTGLTEADKTNFENRLIEVQKKIDDNVLQVDLTAMFGTLHWENVTDAQLDTVNSMIQHFNDSSLKVPFEAQYNDLLAIYTARSAVELAEDNLNQVDKDTATPLVSLITDSVIKDQLNDRLTIVQEKIDYAIRYNNILSEISSVESFALQLGKTTPDTAEFEGVMTTVDSAFVQVLKNQAQANLNDGQLTTEHKSPLQQRLEIVQIQVNDGKLLEVIYVLLQQLPEPYEQSHLDTIAMEINKIELSPFKPSVANQLARLQVELDYDLFIDSLDVAIANAATTLVMTDYDTAVALLENVRESDRATFESQLADVLAEILYKQGEEAIQQVEQTLVQNDLNIAIDKVNDIPVRDDLYDLTELLSQVNALQLLINAKDAVENAEDTMSQAIVDVAISHIEKLPDSTLKTDFLNRINIVQTTINNRTDYEKALVAVEKAEGSLMQNHKTTAETLVTALVDSANKNDLLVRLDALQQKIDNKQKNLLDKIVTDLVHVTEQELADFTGIYVYKELLNNYLDIIGQIGEDVTKEQVIEATKLITNLEEAKRSMKEVDIKKYEASFTDSNVSSLVKAIYPVPTALSSIANYLEDDEALEIAIQEMADTMDKPLEEVEAEVQSILAGEKLAAATNKLRVASLNNLFFFANAMPTVNDVHKQYIYKAFTALAKVKAYVATQNEAKLTETKDYIVNELFNGQYKANLLSYLGLKQSEIAKYQNNDLTKITPKGSSGGNGYIPTPTPEEKPNNESSYKFDLVELQGGQLKLEIEGDLPTEFDQPVQLIIETDKVILDIDGEKYETDLTNQLDKVKGKRILRGAGEEMRAVPQFIKNNRLVITTKNLKDLVISDTPSVKFTDISHVYSKNEIELLNTLQVVQGTTATTYSPNSHMTRAHFAAMISRALELAPKSDNLTFADTKGKWYAADVQALYEAGIITGFEDGTFNGGGSLTRQQTAAMIGRMLTYLGVEVEVGNGVPVQFKDTNQIAEYAKSSVQYLAENNIIQHGSTIQFNPQSNLTRAQMAKMLMRALELSSWY